VRRFGPLGTWKFIVQPVWWNSLKYAIASSTGCTTTAGNQQLLLTGRLRSEDPSSMCIASNGGGFGALRQSLLLPMSPLSIGVRTVGSPVSTACNGRPSNAITGDQGMVAPQYFLFNPTGLTVPIIAEQVLRLDGLCTLQTGGKLYLRTDGTTNDVALCLVMGRRNGRRSDCRVTMIWEKSLSESWRVRCSARVAVLLLVAYRI